MIFRYYFIQKLCLSLVILLVTSWSFSQTSNCDDTPGGQLTVGAACSPVAFNSTNNTNYWDDAWFWGSCNEDDLDDAWMWFDATSTTTTVTYTPLSGDPILTIFQGACSPTMSSNIACSDNIGLTAETLTFSTIPGTRYRVRIQNYASNNSMNGTVCAFGIAGGGTTTASDCSVATNVCTDLAFQIDPNGFGAINEIPASGSLGNPSTNPASANFGCLLVGEYNSTWMIVNVATSGNLEFVFGGLGAQAGYYDWIMYPYNGAATCTAIIANTQAPVRCNWNAVNYGGTGISDVVPGGGDPGNFEPPLAVLAGQQYIICFSNYSNALTTVPLQFLGDPGDATVSCTPLGFSMDGLSVECLPTARLISWTGPAQQMVNKFVVEKSRDNQLWDEVGTVINGALSDNKMQYVIVDEGNPNVLEYYRVKQFMNDGEIVLSSIISADCDDLKDAFTIYPNPNKGIMNLEYSSASDAILEFFDVYGSVVYRQVLEPSMKSKVVQIQTENVPAGMYLYRITMENEVKSGSVILLD